MPAPQIEVAPDCRGCEGRSLSVQACQKVMDGIVSGINLATVQTGVKATELPEDFCGDAYINGDMKPIHLLEKDYA